MSELVMRKRPKRARAKMSKLDEAQRLVQEIADALADPPQEVSEEIENSPMFDEQWSRMRTIRNRLAAVYKKHGHDDPGPARTP